MTSVTLRSFEPRPKMHRVRGAGARRAWRIGAVALVLAGIPARAVPAGAQSVSPSPRPPILEGEVSGDPAAGGRIEIKVDALVAGGWQGLYLVEAALVVAGEEVDRLTYDTENVRIVLDGQKMTVGTGADASGRYLRVSAADVVVTTGGANLSLRIRAQVLRAIPEDARFVLSATGDRGEVASIRRGFAEPAAGGLSWSTVLAAVVLAVLAGAFGGNLFASHRRPPARLSVYGTIRRRIDADRAPTAGGP